MYSSIYRTLILPLWELKQKRHTRHSLQQLKANARLSRAQVQACQFQKLKSIIQHAYDHTKYYRQVFDALGCTPASLTTIADLGRLPFVTREILNDRHKDMIADTYAPNEIHYDATGGSSGLTTRFARDNACLAIKKAAEYRFNGFTGWKPGEKILYYWPALKDFARTGSPRSLLKNQLLTREILLYAGKLNPEVLSEHVQILQRFKPALIRCFPSALQQLAEYCKEQAIRLPVSRGIISVGEPLLDSQRVIFQEIFCAPAYNCYVSRETGNMACECNQHNGLHVADDMVFIEVVNPDINGMGEIAVTDLTNYGMPLIRYRIQDACRIPNKACPCGSNFTRIDLSGARLTDYFIAPTDNSFISGASLVHYLLAEGSGLGRMQLVQDAQDHILVRIADNEQNCSEGMQQIRTKIDAMFKGSMRTDFEFVESIPFLASGKYCFAKRTFTPSKTPKDAPHAN